MEFRRMDMETLKWKQLQEIRDLENNGLLDANFRNCLSLKEDSSPLFLLNLINVFFTDGLSDITEMTRLLDQPAVDFNMMYIKCVKIKGGSSCFGACGVSNACSDLCSAIDNKSKEGCRQALKSIKHQYYILGSRLDKVVKIEQVIAGRQI